MINYSKIPLKFQDFLFSQQCFCTIQIHLSLCTNFHQLKHCSTRNQTMIDYKFFGCKCYPYLSEYCLHKLDDKFVPCVFLGYPQNQKGFICLDRKKQKFYFSRNLTFCEDDFTLNKLLDEDNGNIEKIGERTRSQQVNQLFFSQQEAHFQQLLATL